MENAVDELSRKFVRRRDIGRTWRRDRSRLGIKARTFYAGSLVRFHGRRLVPYTCGILAWRNATSAKLQRPATVTAHHHAIKYTIGFVHAGNYKLHSLTWPRTWCSTKGQPSSDGPIEGFAGTAYY